MATKVLASPPTGEISEIIDTYGLLCPIPIIKATKAFKTLKDGAIIKIIATDTGAPPDLKAWCKANKHTYLYDEREGRVFSIWIQKGRIE